MTQRKKRILSFLTSVLTATGTVSSLAQAMPANAYEAKTYHCSGFDVTYEINGSWNDAYQAMLTVTNTGTEIMENWSLLFDCASPILSAWNASLDDRKGSQVIASNLRYNHDIAPGESTVFGFTGEGEPCFPQSFENVSDIVSVNPENYTVSYEEVQVVGTLHYLDVTIANNSDAAIENWKLEFDYPCMVSEVWNAALLSEDETVHLVGYAENAYIDPASEIMFGMVVNTDAEDISDLFYDCSMEQVHRYTTAELDLPMRADITDELGGVYHITWQSDGTELPVVSAYPESLDDLIYPEARYSVSQLGAVWIQMPEMRGTATVETAFTEKPDMVMMLDENRHMLRMIAFQSDDVNCTFRLSGSAVIIPLKLIRRTTTTAAESTNTITETTTSAAESTNTITETTTSAAETITTVTETTTTAAETTTTVTETTTTAAETTTTVTETTTTAAETTTTVTETTTSAAESTATVTETTISVAESTMMNRTAAELEQSKMLLQSAPRRLLARGGSPNSPKKRFNITSNSNGSFTVDISDLMQEMSDYYSEDGFSLRFCAQITDNGTCTLLDIPSNGVFSYTSAATYFGKVEVDIINYIDLYYSPAWCEYCWQQDVYVQKSASLSVTRQNALLAKYAPIVMYTSDEEYAPMKIEDIFAAIPDNTSFTSLTMPTFFGSENINISDLQNYLAYNGNSGYLLDWTDSLKNDNDKSFKKIKGSFSDPTVYQYYQEDATNIYLNYYFFYGYDKKNSSGSHNMDRESMFVVLNKSTEEPEYVVTGGHLEDTKIQYSKKVNWKNELVKVPYDQTISAFSEGHPIVSAETYQHCVMPLAGAYETYTYLVLKQENNAGIVDDLESSTHKLDLDKQHVIFPANFHSAESLNHYDSVDLKVNAMFGSNVLNFSGCWVDVAGSGNVPFPPFLDRDFDKTTKLGKLDTIEPNTISKQKVTKRTDAQFSNAYLFSLTTVNDFTYSDTGNGVVLNWEAIPGASGYEIVRRLSNGQNEAITVNDGTKETYTDTALSSRNYKIKAFYTVDRSLYGGSGSFKVYNKEAEVSNTKGSVLVTVRDADTNQILSGVSIYLDGNLIGKTTNGAYTVSVSAGSQHTIRTEKNGYLSVEYREITAQSGETVSLDTLMQVPYNANAPLGNATLTIKNAQSGAIMPNVDFVIRKGMNTTTGAILKTAISNANGIVTLTDLNAGNYTGVIEKDGYIKTVFNFAIIGGKNKSYEVHVSPILSGQEIRLVLSWGANPRDLDSHITGSNVHVFYGSKVAKGINLDVDDVDGYGPETVTVNLSTANSGVYNYYIHRYAGSGTIHNSGATIKVYRGNTLLKTYSAEQAGSGDDWYVCRINTATGAVTDW